MSFNLDTIAVQLLSNPRITQVSGLLDSSFWLDIAPLSNTSLPFVEQVQRVVRLGNPILNPTCALQERQSWRCLMGQYLVPYLQTNFLLHAFQYDAYQLSGDLGIPFESPVTKPPQLEFAEAFRAQTRANATKDVPPPSSIRSTAAHLPACYAHCNTESERFSTLATNGFTLEQVCIHCIFIYYIFIDARANGSERGGIGRAHV